MAAMGTYLVASGGRNDPTTRYVVAGRDLAPGEIIGADDIRMARLDLPVDQARGTFSDPAQLNGAVMRGPLQEGAIVTSAAVEQASAAHAGANYRELSVTLAADRAVGGTLRPGDRVDVAATANGTTHVLVQRVTVLAATSGRNGSPLSSGDVTVTLALPDAAPALAVAHGAAAAELTLLRSSRAATPLPELFRLPTAPAAGAAAAATSSSAPTIAGAAGSTAERRG
ncbi:MAG: hypothetical protein QOJ19_3493 [Acidimicrobiia bacterium]|nr:hypothetical protein [Acidimicrobiia bacterium]